MLPVLAGDRLVLPLITWSNLHQIWKFLWLNISERSEESTEGVSVSLKTIHNSGVDRERRFDAMSHFKFDL